MTDSNDLTAAEAAVLHDVADALREILAGYATDLPLTAATNLQTDLELESIDLIRLSSALSRRYGPAVNMAEYLSGLSFGAIDELTLGDLARYVCARIRPAGH